MVMPLRHARFVTELIVIAMAMPVAASFSPPDAASGIGDDSEPVVRFDSEEPIVHVVEVKNTAFTDASGDGVTEARVGEVIRFVWMSGTHSVTHGVAGLNVTAFGGPDTKTHTATTPLIVVDYPLKVAGDFPYTCKLHASMNGLLRVATSG